MGPSLVAGTGRQVILEAFREPKPGAGRSLPLPPFLGQPWLVSVESDFEDRGCQDTSLRVHLTQRPCYTISYPPSLLQGQLTWASAGSLSSVLRTIEKFLQGSWCGG